MPIATGSTSTPNAVPSAPSARPTGSSGANASSALARRLGAAAPATSVSAAPASITRRPCSTRAYSSVLPQNTSGTASTTPVASTINPTSARAATATRTIWEVCRRGRAVTSTQRDHAVRRAGGVHPVGRGEPARLAREPPADLHAPAVLEPLVPLDRPAELLQIPAGGLGGARLGRARGAQPADRRHLVRVHA